MNFETFQAILWPPVRAFDAHLQEKLYQEYEEAASKIQEEGALSEDKRLLEMVRWMFENESIRRQTIDSRAEILLGATGVLLTLTIGLAANLLLGLTEALSLGAYVILVVYGVMLAMLIRAALITLAIHGNVWRYIIGPVDLVGATERQLSVALLRYTIQNYRANARQTEALFAAQVVFRNAVTLIGVAGVGFAIIAIVDLYA